jgi:hypothetical protein
VNVATGLVPVIDARNGAHVFANIEHLLYFYGFPGSSP